MSMIEVSHLKYRYPDTTELALNDISFRVEKGEFIGIAGGNGSGKSTLCYALAGLVPHFFKGAYGGKVIVNGMEVRKMELEDYVGNVGLVLDNPFSQLTGATNTVFEEIAFGLENIGVEQEEMIRRVQECLDLLQISDIRHQHPFSLSGGQMQRTAIASIIAMQPDVLILDEPTSQLDPAGAEEVFRVVERLAKMGMTIVMTEHNTNRLAQYADKLILLDKGALQAFDSPAAVFTHIDTEQLGVSAPVITQVAKKLEIKNAHTTFYPITIQEAQELLQWQDTIGKEALREICHRELGDNAEQAPANSGNLLQDNEARKYDINLQVKNLTFAYESVEVLRKITLSFNGEATAIIGQNGAGKSTFVKLLKGLLRPKKGEIRLNGTSLEKWSPAQIAGKIGLVFQNPNDQIFKSTVLQEVMFGPLNIGYAEEEARNHALQALEKVGLAKSTEMNPYDLSLSERKLVTIASIFAMDTDVVIFDEPTMGQDAIGKRIIRDIIADLRRQGKLVLCILHDMDFAAAVFDRIIVFSEGKVVGEGTPLQIFSDKVLLKQAHLQAPVLFQLATEEISAES